MKNRIETGMLFEVKNLTIEGTGDDERVYVEGIVQRANAKNKNGRVYPKEILEEKVKQYMKEFVQNQNAFGELDHPESSVVELKNASHTIEDLWWDGDDLYAKLEILDTPAGMIARKILKKGKKLGISSRALGSVEVVREADGDTVQVQDDLELICWDLVSNPSTHRAFVSEVNEGLIVEGVDRKSNQRNRVDEIFNDIICNMTGACEIK